MKKILLTTASLFFCLVICFAAIEGLAGKWSGSIKTPDGNDIDLTYIFKVDGAKLTGTAISQGIEIPIDSGKVNGNEFKFSVTNPDGVTIPHKGKYLGDSVSIDLDYQGTNFHSTLKRVDK
ncbi:hypothetical protein HDF24_24695 [Mucilaginibacter sp. X4EP1]|uniref:hypothetical protein n=1 Tax=Mucilaginibacter sp. X4EP1 TaxID=2723092 RepID=UPI0021685F2A|nr:hypothetical protein [Mucilaginibacter sp. X4EP1]MCS3815194.1 hypothetical protein [Mucilaginibacter sp. X4EP1]